MNKIQHEIDQELSQMKLPSDFAEDIIRKGGKTTKPFYKNFSAAAVLIGAVLILGTSAAAAYILHWETSVNDQPLPELDKITVYPYAKEGQELQIRYDSYEELKKEMPFPLLDSEYSKDEEVLYAEYISYPYNCSLQAIRVTGFIRGDAKLLEISEDKNSSTFESTWEAGEEFSGPVDLEIEILSDENQTSEQIIDSQFAGDFKFIEQYTSKQGYKVNIITTTYTDKCHHAIFVADGMKYTLKGGVSLEKMKELVDSMEY